MTEKTIWISYDLGIQGDYTGLYSWLDKYDAKECGDSLAFFKSQDSENFPADVEEDFKKEVTLSPTDRIYIIYHDKNGITRGKFIKGGRKKAPWEGYGLKTINELQEDY